MQRNPFLPPRCSGIVAALLVVVMVDAVADSNPSTPSHRGLSRRSLSITSLFADQSPITVKINTDLVQIPVTVTDRDDHVIEKLNKENFLVYENGVQQVIAHFETSESPISACVVFDSSLSMANKIHKSIEAISELLDAAISDDEYCLVRFSDWPEIMVGIANGPAQVSGAIKTIHPAGFTALLDGIYLGVQEVKRGHNRRKAILLISDGGDNRSRHTKTQILHLVREADAQVYSIGITSPEDQMYSMEEVDGPTLMKKISHESGGRLFRINDTGELPSAISKIMMALRHQYMLGYYPKDTHNDGKYRHITVKLELPKTLPRARMYWRTGYYAPNR